MPTSRRWKDYQWYWNPDTPLFLYCLTPDLEVYEVGDGDCTCPDFAFRAFKWGVCKHVEMYRELHVSEIQSWVTYGRGGREDATVQGFGDRGLTPAWRDHKERGWWEAPRDRGGCEGSLPRGGADAAQGPSLPDGDPYRELMEILSR